MLTVKNLTVRSLQKLRSINILENISELNSKGFLITTEFVVKSFKRNKKILEIPIVDLGIDSISTVKPLRDGFKMLFNILKLRVNINR